MIYYVELIGLKWSLTLVSMAGFGYTYFNSDYDFGLCSSLFFRGISCLYKHYGVGDICPERQLAFPLSQILSSFFERWGEFERWQSGVDYVIDLGEGVQMKDKG
jgi:hypothetical protein